MTLGKWASYNDITFTPLPFKLLFGMYTELQRYHTSHLKPRLSYGQLHSNYERGLTGRVSYSVRLERKEPWSQCRGRHGWQEGSRSRLWVECWSTWIHGSDAFIVFSRRFCSVAAPHSALRLSLLRECWAYLESIVLIKFSGLSTNSLSEVGQGKTWRLRF